MVAGLFGNIFIIRQFEFNSEENDEADKEDEFEELPIGKDLNEVRKFGERGILIRDIDQEKVLNQIKNYWTKG